MAMKISELNNLNQMVRTATGVERREAPATGRSFQHELSNLNRENYMERLTSMGQDIERQGLVLAQRADILQLKKYKEMLGEFMHEAVRFAFEFDKNSKMDARGRHRVYALIKRINQKLEELTQQVLSGQKDTVAMLQAIDEIRGMLIDLYM